MKSLLFLRILFVSVLMCFLAPTAFAQKPANTLLTPTNHTLVFIDHQPQMAFATRSIDIAELRNNVTGLAKAAKVFKVPVVLTTVASKSFSGPIFPELQAVFPDERPVERTSMNSWEDQNFVNAVQKIGRKRLVLAGMWTEVCIMGPALSAIEEGYEVYVVADASGGVSTEAHNRAMERMIQAGVRPITWMQYLLELQRDWARQDTYAATSQVVMDHAGSYGLGVIYAHNMVGAHADEGASATPTKTKKINRK